MSSSLCNPNDREEREFNLRMAIHERWSSREPEAQFRRGAFEQVLLSAPKLSPLARELLSTHNLTFHGASIRLEEEESNLRRSIEGLFPSRGLERDFRPASVKTLSGDERNSSWRREQAKPESEERSRGMSDSIALSDLSGRGWRHQD